MPTRPNIIKRPWTVERVAFQRPKDFSRFYNGRPWRKVSTAFRDANPVCAECIAAGTVGPADVTDHIRGLQFLLDNGLDFYDTKELQSLCHKHHNIKSGKESHKINK